MWWRVTILALGVAGFAVALWHDRFGVAFFLFVVLFVLAYVLRLPQTTHEATAGIERPRMAGAELGEARVRATETHPAISGSREAALTLWAKNESTVRQLLDDEYFLMGVLMSETSDAVSGFLDVLGQGGTVSGQATPNPTRGGYDVNITIRRAREGGAS